MTATADITAGQKRVGLVACGALAREVLALADQPGLRHIEVKFLPAALHNTPRDIPAAVDKAMHELSSRCEVLFAGYGDCGTAGKLDEVLEKHGAERLPGAHCYAFFTGLDRFEEVQDREPGTFYLTDYLARQFDTLVYKPLGLDRHPELLEAYFGNYTRLMHLVQTPDEKLDAKAREAADRLGLRYERIETGFGLLEPFLKEAAQ
ncbi:DUF1638 domain-containing protein [Cucumibacter marinus]|uniref:DUF1638 domain-containing protein n=1 Tax=Cucumibacter marinus TaxID=1121252 RepID=UPI0003FB385B|nr:DUF1638 domain-containing protein [Cucumibacter marinus]